MPNITTIINSIGITGIFFPVSCTNTHFHKFIQEGRGGLNIQNMRIINKALKQYAKKTKRVEFIDMFTPLIDSSGKLRSDLCSDHYCHLTFAGYKIYGDTLREFAKSRLIKDTGKEDREFTKNEVKKYKLTK